MGVEIPLAGPFEPLGLEELVAWVEDELDLDDRAALASAALPLRRLAENRDLLVDALVARLRAWRDDDKRNAFDQESLVLHHGGRFAVRANVWRPPEVDPGLEASQKRQAPYGHFHNHNFPFLTVGYLGAGYRTLLYRCDPAQVVGYVGEPVDLTFVGETSLPRGKVMHYRAYEDIHQQFQPDELSISLNLVVLSPVDPLRNQLHFDVEAGRVLALDGRGQANRMFLRLLFEVLDSARLAEPLEALAARHPAPEMRDFAWEALARLPDVSAEEVWTRALQDPAPRVRTIARMALEGELPPRR